MGVLFNPLDLEWPCLTSHMGQAGVQSTPRNFPHHLPCHGLWGWGEGVLYPVWLKKLVRDVGATGSVAVSGLLTASRGPNAVSGPLLLVQGLSFHTTGGQAGSGDSDERPISPCVTSLQLTDSHSLEGGP